MNVRVKALKRQLDEVEEEVQREKSGKRKAQRELEDMLETHETLTRECNNLRNKLRYTYYDTTRLVKKWSANMGAWLFHKLQHGR